MRIHHRQEDADQPQVQIEDIVEHDEWAGGEGGEVGETAFFIDGNDVNVATSIYFR
jgi:hypothetical protein